MLNPKSICHQLLRVVVKVALNHGCKYQVTAVANDIQFPGRVVRNTTRRSRFILRARHGFYDFPLSDVVFTAFSYLCLSGVIQWNVKQRQKRQRLKSKRGFDTKLSSHSKEPLAWSIFGDIPFLSMNIA